MNSIEVDLTTTASQFLDQINGIIERAIRQALVQLLETGTILLVGIEISGQQQVFIGFGQLRVDVGLEFGFNTFNATITSVADVAT